MLHEASDNPQRYPDIRNQNIVMIVHGQSRLWDGVGLIACGGLFAGLASERLAFFVAGVFLMLLGFLLLLLAIPQAGKPILTLSDKGFNTPAFGFIPWNSVRGIDKYQTEHRGIKFSPVLILYVPELKNFKKKFHPIYRILYRGKTVNLTLRHSDVRPEVILSVARKLWTECTGLEHYWSVYSTYEVNEAYRRIAEKRKHEKVLIDCIEEAANDNNDLKVKTLLKQVESNNKELRSDWQIIHDDLKKRNKILKYVAVITVLFFVVYILLLFRF